ncbi:MAG: Asp-tRNA(Asn)/Glu-tRNA(Gln) amidotransferase GatCAB subunit C [Bacilli bacterium]|nr:Asp-tRNA(Asn)/Glu-tRNA(Gln) amidotransferase GatCAB subunit C [Bacilli bacterium]
MDKVNKETLKKCARGLMFDMTEEQYDVLESEFDLVLEQMKLMDCDGDLNDYSPMTFPFDVTTDFLREDDVTETITREEALSNAKEILDNQIKLPKVVG